MGHIHYALGDEEVALGYGQQMKKRIFLVTGSFLKSYMDQVTTYAERKIYPPIPLAAMQLIVDKDGLHYSRF